MLDTLRFWVAIAVCNVACNHGETKELQTANAAATTIANTSSIDGGQFENSIGMMMKRIAPGTFAMGSPADEEGHYENEKQHTVAIVETFYIGCTEVTQDEYSQVMGNNPSQFKPPLIKDSEKHPVECVSWYDANEFCRRLTSLEVERRAKRVYRLPTEAEWEYAARAGSKTAFSYGQTARREFMNCCDVSGSTKPVMTYPPNAWGLYEMHGNISEWCSDWYDSKYYEVSPASSPHGPDKGLSKITRGGSWLVNSRTCRSAWRATAVPKHLGQATGFRVVCVISEAD